jgi:hypothetical protein
VGEFHGPLRKEVSFNRQDAKVAKQGNKAIEPQISQIVLIRISPQRGTKQTAFITSALVVLSCGHCLDRRHLCNLWLLVFLRALGVLAVHLRFICVTVFVSRC